MSFLAPLTLFGLALLALPVLIHLLVRRRAQRLDFPTLRFLRETPSFRLRPRRVREPLLLALRLAALALLIAGLARPFVSFNARSAARARVIVMDASLSMSTRGRAEAAREQARSILKGLDAGERVALVSFSSTATVLAEATSDRERLKKALEDYEPVGDAADYSVGLASAAGLLQREPPGASEIDLISDFQESGLSAMGPPSSSPVLAAARVVPFAVGTPIERNAFLTGATVERNASVTELSATEIVSGPEGETGARRTWAIDASEAARPDIEWHTQSNGQLTGVARTNAPDDFDADDQLFFAFMPPREKRALLIEGNNDGPYLRAALEAAVAGEANRLVLEQRAALPASADELASYTLVVLTLHGSPVAEQVRVLSDYARAGGNVWLCLARDLDVEGWNAFALTEQGNALPFLSLARKTQPQPFGLGTLDGEAAVLSPMEDGTLASLRAVRVHAGYSVTPRETATTLARWNDATPAFVSAETGAGTLLLLATSTAREASDLGLSPALPALASSILSAAKETQEPLARGTGEPVQLRLHPATEVKVTDTHGHTTLLQARDMMRRSQTLFRAPGLYSLEFAGQQRFLAFNAPGEESARALASPERINDYLARALTADSGAVANDWRESFERRGHAWRLFLCAAFILLVAELLISIRGRGI